MMDKEFLRKCKKAHANILKCIEEAYKRKDLNLMLINVKRLNDLTLHYDRTIWIHIGENEALKQENSILEADNRKLMDESFLSISESKGQYQHAKKLLDEFYGAERD